MTTDNGDNTRTCVYCGTVLHPEEVGCGCEQATRHEQVARWIERKAEHAAEECDTWAQGFAQDAHYAMQWAADTFRAAARCAVFTQVVGALRKEGNTLEFVMRYARDQVVRGARYPERSTSQAHNLAKQEEVAAWAELLEYELAA